MTVLTVVLGVVLVVLGVTLVAARHTIPRIMFTGLRRRWGSPFTDMVGQRFGPGIVVVVAIVAIMLGARNVVEALLS